MPRVATPYRKNGDELQRAPYQNQFIDNNYSSGAGGLMASAEGFLRFGQMLLNGGQLNGKRLLSPKTVDLMASVHTADVLPGLSPGRSFGLSVQVINNAVAANLRVSDGSYGWNGAFGTHFWVDPKEKIVGLLMIQGRGYELSRDFENAVMQAIVE